MESALFALDLLAMLVFCFWAIRQDTQDQQDQKRQLEKPDN